MELFFAELLVRGTLLCLLAALALLLMRRAAAAYRHLICTLALCGLLALPLVGELLPPLPLLATATKPVVMAVPVALEPIPSAPQRIEQPLPADPPMPSLPQGGWRSEERTKPGGYGWVPPGGFALLPLAWALGASLLLLRLGVALVRLRTLARQSQRTTFLETEILVSAHVPTPLTWGVRRPVILLPAALLSGDPAVVESALRHEQAHIARRDWLWHLLAEVVCALCWFQPGAWWLRRQLRAESERACDDRVLLSGTSGPDYAAHLLEILRAGRASALAPGMAASGSMEVRVKHILDPKKPRRSHSLRLALTAALGLVLLPLASLKVSAKSGEQRPVSRLQAAVEQLAPKLTFLTPSALLAQAKATLSAPNPIAVSFLAAPSLALPANPLSMPQAISPSQPFRGSDLPLQNAVWGKAVDGLKPGLVLLSTPSVPLGSRMSYQVLVHNTTDKPLDFILQCLPYDGKDVPWLLPKENIMEELTSGKVPPELCAQGSPHVLDGIDPAYVVTLAPGETVVVPGTYSLFVGKGKSDGSPSLAMAQAGRNWLVQPLTCKRISPDERTKYTRLLGEFTLTKIDRTGKSRTENAIRIPAIRDGKALYATRLIDVVPKGSNTTIPLDKVVWGMIVDGLEPGLLLTGVTDLLGPGGLAIGYTALVRNRTKQPITFLVRLLQYEGYDVPFTQDDSAKIPDTERARGVQHAGVGLDAVYQVTLAPGESVLVPGQEAHHNLQVLIGSGDGGKSPYFAKLKGGMDMLVQPLTVYRSPDTTKLPLHLTKCSLTKMSPDGTLHTEGAINVSMPGSGGTQLEAKLWLPKVLGTSKTPTAPATPTASEPSGRVLPLDKVIWNEAVDGLAAGFLLTSSSRVPLNSKLTYQTLVRNTSNKPISFLTRLLQYDGYETPTVDGKPTKGAKRGYPVDPLYSVTLAPGESVIVPAQNGRENLELYVGEGGSADSPRIAAITPGHQKIVQPIKIYRAPENLEFADMFGRYSLTKASPDGRVRTEGANRATGLGGGTGRIEGGQTLEAYTYLEIGTRNAEAQRSAASAIWGKVDRGLQCGLRMISTRKFYEVGDTLEAELLWRNAGDKKAHWVLPRQLDLWPIIRDAQGKEHHIDTGARFRLLPGSADYAPGEVRSLGTLKVTLVAEGTPSPKSNREPGHITLAPGTYFFSGSGGVSRAGDPCPHSGEVAFTVVSDAPQSPLQKADGVVWGKVDKGLQCGIRMLTDRRKFLTGDTLEAELLWRNVSDKKAYWVHPRQLDIVPFIREASGRGRGIDTGARFELVPFSTDYAPGEVRSLGVLKVTLVPEGMPSPKSNRQPGHITLAPGIYFFSGSGGVSGQGDPCPRSGEVAFTVVDRTPQPQKDEGIAWGKEVGGVRYGLRDTDSLKTLEVLVQNVSGQTETSRYIVWPPDLAGRLVVRDSAGKARPVIQVSAKQAPRTETLRLRPNEIALLHTKALQHMLGTLKPGESYTVEWQGGNAAQVTGRLAFQAPEPDPTAWGRGFNGVQLGLRLPKGTATFSKLSEAHFEVVLRNLGKPTSVSWITPANFSFYGPDLFTKDGEPIPYEHTVAGPYRGQNRDLGSGETIVLGTIRLPREVQERWDSLPQGPYLASGPPPPSPYEARFSLGITVSGKGEQKLSARLPFTLTRPR